MGELGRKEVPRTIETWLEGAICCSNAGTTKNHAALIDHLVELGRFDPTEVCTEIMPARLDPELSPAA